MPDSLVPTDDLPEELAQGAPAASGAPVPTEDLPASGGIPIEAGDREESSTLGAAAEGVAKGIAGPLATGAELGLSKLGVPGLSAEDQAQRQEEHPYVEGAGEAAGLIGGAFIPGLGEYTLGAKIGEYGKAAAATAKALDIGKVGQAAIKLGIEGGLFHLSDNTSKMILGQTDPEAPVASLMAGMPAAVLMGGTLGYVGGKAGAKLQNMASSKMANTASQWLADFGNRFHIRSGAGDIVESGTGEAQHLYDTVSSAVDDAFSLKRDSVEKLTEKLDPNIVSAYVNGMRHTLENVPQELQGSSAFKRALGEWQSAITPSRDVLGAPTSSVSSADIFEATDNFKRQLGEIAKFDAPWRSSADQEMGRGAGKLYHYVRTSLENPGAWGEMGDFQKNLNKAYSDMQNPLKDFLSAATTKKTDAATNIVEREVDPGKIAGAIRSIAKGKPVSGLKPDKITDFIPKARKFLDTVDALHASQGIESQIPRVSTTTLDEMLNKNVPAGARAANAIFDRGPGAVGWAGGHLIGTAVGAVTGHPYLGYRAGEHLAPLLQALGERPTKWAIAGALRALGSGNPGGIAESIAYSKGIANGAARIDASLNNLFKVGGKQYLESDHSEADRTKLNKFVESGALNQQLQNQAQPPVTEVEEGPKGFAHGGEVLAPEPKPVSTKNAGKITPKKDVVASVFPEQAMLLGAAKGRINNYLNQLRPQDIQSKRPFDEHVEDHAKKKTYNRALDIANKPLSVIDKIKNGTLEPDDVRHLNELHPELANHLRKQITQKITDAQMKNEKPPHKVRQGLSLFMGTALDSNLTPQNIMAAQATFSMQKAQQAAQGQAPKKNTDKLSKVDNQYRTSEQAAVARQTDKP